MEQTGIRIKDDPGRVQVQSASSTINELADRQWGVVARHQLIGVGLSSELIRSRIRTGFFYPVDRAVYCLGRGPMEARAIWMAAVLSVGGSAVLCGRSAAALLGFFDQDLVVDVRCPHSRRRFNARIQPPVGPSRFVHVRRLRSFEPRGVKVVDGIPVAGAAAALVQMAEQMTPDGLKNAYLSAEMNGLLEDDDLAWLIEPKPGQKGIRNLRELVLRRDSDVARTRSVLEARVRSLISEEGLPPPQINVPVGRYRVDFYWPEIGLIVEGDGRKFHRGEAKRIDDQERQNELVAAGNSVLRLDWAQVVNQPAKARSTLRQSYDKRAAERGRF